MCTQNSSRFLLSANINKKIHVISHMERKKEIHEDVRIYICLYVWWQPPWLFTTRQYSQILTSWLSGSRADRSVHHNFRPLILRLLPRNWRVPACPLEQNRAGWNIFCMRLRPCNYPAGCAAAHRLFLSRVTWRESLFSPLFAFATASV